VADETPFPQRALDFARENPGTTAIMGIATLAGSITAWWFEIGDLSPTGRLLGGAFAGAWFGLFPLGVRLFD
jgi:hypothetical protein